MTWRTVSKSFQAVLAHGLLFTFTLLLSLKLDRAVYYSWWVIFFPLWLFHVVVARGRFSLPAPSIPHDRHWAPFHAVMATPLLVAFELLLCIHLERRYAMSLKIVFLPLLAFESAILVDNVRMCRALMPGDEQSMSNEAIWETLPHFWVAISMVFFIAATIFTLLKLCGDAAALGWWDLFINYSVAECFAFLTCKKWNNPAIHRRSCIRPASTSSTTFRYLNWNSGLVISSDEDYQRSRICSLQDIGGHVMKVPLVVFQILLFMRLEGTPSGARHIPIRVLFAPLFLLQGTGVMFAIYRLLEKVFLLLQGTGVMFAIYRLLEKVFLLLYSDTASRIYSRISAGIRDSLGFMHHGSSLLGWWSIDESSREEQARLFLAGASGYNTFSPDTVRKMPKSELAAEIWRLQAALGEQTEITKFSQEEYEKLQNEKILCRICFEEPINMVLLPCRHHILCSTCGDKCKRCPICRVFIEERLPVYDV